MKSTITIRLDEIEKEVIKNYVNNKSLTISEFIKKIILDYIEDEYDLKIYKEYLKEKATIIVTNSLEYSNFFL